jgi:hypothetical protein
LTTPPNWSLSYCISVDPEVFFDENLEELAKSFCQLCKIRPECLQYALSVPEVFGVWGGVSPSTRNKVNVTRTRVKCPGCFSAMINEEMSGVQHCDACGLSWKV